MKIKDKFQEKVQRLEQIRESRNMSQGKFATEELDVTRQTYWNWLNEKHKPTLESWLTVKKYLGD